MGNDSGRITVSAPEKDQVEQLLSAGMTHADIARVVGCKIGQFRRIYAEQIATGAAKKRAEVVELLYASARDGNVSALKALEALTRAVVAPEGGAVAGAELGKKQQQQQAAERVTGVFAVPEPPKLVVNNG